jgi:hypothetical protein
MACFAFGIIIYNEPHIVLPWNRADCHPDVANNEWCAVQLLPTFGWSWYLVLLTGIAVVAIGGILTIIDFFVPRWTATWFHHNIIEEDEELLTEVSEDQPLEEEGGYSTEYRGRGRTGRTTRVARSISKYRQTQRRPRSTVRDRTGSQKLKGDIPLTEINVIENVEKELDS